jgi:hypothetical protein
MAQFHINGEWRNIAVRFRIFRRPSVIKGIVSRIAIRRPRPMRIASRSPAIGALMRGYPVIRGL